MTTDVRHLPRSQRVQVPLSHVRVWAREQGIPVPARGHISQQIIDRFNRHHRKVFAGNNNPWKGQRSVRDINERSEEEVGDAQVQEG